MTLVKVASQGTASTVARSSGRHLARRACIRKCRLVACALPFLLLTLASHAAATPCWDIAAQRHGIAPALLYAIARTESNFEPSAVNRSHWQRTGSYDIGLMQINSRHLPLLARRGIQEADLLHACTNLQVGAWLLADLFARYGVSWNAVGAYNASCTKLDGEACAQARAMYAWKVYRNLPTRRGLAGSGLAPFHDPRTSPRSGAYEVAL